MHAFFRQSQKQFRMTEAGYHAIIISCCRIFALALAFSLCCSHVQAATQIQATACRTSTQAWVSMKEQTIALVNNRGNGPVLKVKVADQPEEIAAGYQYLCPEVIQDSAILFDFGTTVSSRFHMQNVFAPLDIAFFSQEGTLINTATMKPEPPGSAGKRILYRARSPYRYVLETSKGRLPTTELMPGTTRLVLSTQP